MQGTDHGITKQIEEYLGNLFSIGIKSYPCDLANATNVIINYKRYVNNINYPENKGQQWKKYLEKESNENDDYESCVTGVIGVTKTIFVTQESNFDMPLKFENAVGL